MQTKITTAPTSKPQLKQITSNKYQNLVQCCTFLFLVPGYRSLLVSCFINCIYGTYTLTDQCGRILSRLYSCSTLLKYCILRCKKRQSNFKLFCLWRGGESGNCLRREVNQGRMGRGRCNPSIAQHHSSSYR